MKKGTRTVGVQRQYTGTADRVENSRDRHTPRSRSTAGVLATVVGRCRSCGIRGPGGGSSR
jgi:hypothetical protein